MKHIVNFLLLVYTNTYATCPRSGLPRHFFSKPDSHLYLLVFFLVFFSSIASAYCSTSSVYISPPNLALNQNSVAINAPLGAELVSPTTAIATCSINQSYVTANSSYHVTTINGRAIYETNTSGIGFAFGFEPDASFCTSGVVWDNAQNPSLCSSSYTTLKGKYHVQFYKIGNIVSTNNIAIYASTSPEVVIGDGYSGFYISHLKFNSFNVTVPTCSLTSSSTTTVNLPPISSTSLPSLYSTSGSTPFSIAITCPTPTNLNITFTDNNQIGQSGNYLTPSSSSSAQGLGIQLKYNGNIISFGPDSSEPNTTNQIVLNSNFTGGQTFPFTAAYVRTGTVTPGTLTARATFTLSYQ